MPACDHCGNHISDRFARVFADEFGEIHACPGCAPTESIAKIAKQRAQRV